MKILSRRFVIISAASATLLAVLTVVGWAQSKKTEPPKPDFSGTWKLNLAKSSFGTGMKPNIETEVITQSEDSLTLAMMSQNETAILRYTVNITIGSPAVGIDQGLFRPEDFMKVQDARAEWNGDALMVILNASFKEDPVTIKSIYTLSPDGKKLTKVVNIDRDAGPIDMTEVYEKP
jgi:hypothetical protein